MLLVGGGLRVALANDPFAAGASPEGHQKDDLVRTLRVLDHDLKQRSK